MEHGFEIQIVPRRSLRPVESLSGWELVYPAFARHGAISSPTQGADGYSTRRGCAGGMAGGEGESTSAPFAVW